MLIVMLLAACGGAVPVPAPPSASKAAADLKIAAQRDLQIDDTRIISLSPDGKWLAALRDRSACIIAVDSLADKQCAEVKTGSLDSRSIVWSPDSQRIAFTEDLPRYMFESDIWTLVVDSGQLTDLTPDNLSGSVISLPQDSAATLDTMPGWSPDGQTLIFARSMRSGDTALYKMSADGGTPQKVLDIAGGGMIAVWYGPHWLNNGKIVYTIFHAKIDDPDNGVWLVDSNGQNARQLVKVTDKQTGLPILRDVSAKGDRALVFYSGALQYAAPNVSYLALLDLTSGQTVPLKPAAEFLSVANAAFSPDGSKINYVYRSADKQTQVMVRDVQNGTDNSLLTQSTLLGTTTDSTVQGLDWANNDTVYAAAAPGSGILFTLSSK